MAAASLPPLTLVLGPEELLCARAVQRVVSAVRLRESTCDVRDIPAGVFTDEHLLDLLSPSMFGELRVLVVRGAQDLADAHRDALIEYAAAPFPDVILVLVHNGGTKGKRLIDAYRNAGAVVLSCPAVTKPGERIEFVQAEVRLADRQVTAGACRALVEAVGNDLRDLAAAAAQLVADVRGTIDEAAVAQFHRGRAETRGFDVADAAIAGDVAGALALLRAASLGGTAAVLISSALASGLRDLARVRGAAGGTAAAVAKTLAMPPWKVERLLRQSRGWADEGVAAAVSAVADADAGVKGAATDPGYALERAVLRISAARSAGQPRR